MSYSVCIYPIDENPVLLYNLQQLLPLKPVVGYLIFKPMSILFKTKLRRKLLNYAFKNHKDSYYVRELSGLIKEDAGNLSRELRNLQNEGLFNSFTNGKAKFYILNKDYPLYKEIKKVVKLTEDMLATQRKD